MQKFFEYTERMQFTKKTEEKKGSVMVIKKVVL